MSKVNNVKHARITQRIFVGVLATAAQLVASAAVAQSWNYQAYNSRDRQPTAAGYITVEEREGKAVLRISAGQLNNCYQGVLDALVTKADATTIITPAPRLRGCEEIRFVIKNDGTGGQREVKQGSDWVWDGFDRRLTPRK